MKKLTAEDFCKATERLGNPAVVQDVALTMELAFAVSELGPGEFDELLDTTQYSDEAADQIFGAFTDYEEGPKGWTVTLSEPFKSVRKDGDVEKVEIDYPNAGLLKRGPRNPKFKREPWRTMGILQECSDMHSKDWMGMGIGDYINIVAMFQARVREKMSGGFAS